MAVSEAPRPPLRWGRILGVLAAAFLVAEAAAQAYFVHWTGRPYGSVFLYLWSPYGLVRNNPKLTGNYTINPNGFREVRVYQQKKPANTFRVLLLGGSVLYSGATPVNTLGKYVPSDQTISQYLAARLKADPAFKGVNVEVINTAVNFNRIVEISSAYLADYIRWSPDVVVVFGSANNFDAALHEGDFDRGATALQQDHPWRGEFNRLVDERSLSSTIEVAFRQAVDASAALSLLHKSMMRGFVENDPFARLAIPTASGRRPDRPIASAEDETRYFDLYKSYASAIIAAAHAEHQEVAFVWEYHLGDLGGIKPLSPEERILYPKVKRSQADIDYDRRMHGRWTAFLAAEHVPTVDPLEAISGTPKTVFTDYLHYTANGNAVVARATYDQLREFLVRKLAQTRTDALAVKTP